MKYMKIKTISVFLSVFTFMFFLSCQQNAGNGLFEYSPVLNSSGSFAKSREYSVITSCNNELINFSSSRTILPDTLSVNDLDFYILGKDKNSGAVLEFSTKTGVSKVLKVEFTSCSDDGRSGCFNLELASPHFIMTMFAVKAGTDVKTGAEYNGEKISLNAIFMGSATGDINSTTINFYLSGDSLYGQNGYKGNVKFGLYTKDWSYTDDEYNNAISNFKCKVGLYKVDLNQTVVYEKSDYNIPVFYTNPTGLQKGIPSSFSDFTGEMDIFDTSVTSGIIPGVYSFTVCFYDIRSSRRYYYSDLIMILANRNIERLIEIPNVIAKAPAAPEGLIVGYIDPQNEDDGKYDAVVEWKDNSLNEEYFQLELIEFKTELPSGFQDYVDCILGKSTTLPQSTHADWAWSNLAGTYGSTIISNDYFEQIGAVEKGTVKGSLSRNSQYVQFGLNLGSRYVMRLCSVNAENEKSEKVYAYPDIYNGTFRTGNNVEHWIWDDLVPENCNRSINRYRIKYSVDSGSFYDDEDAAGGKYTTVSALNSGNVVYRSQSVSGSALWVPKNIDYKDKDNNSKTASLGKVVITGDENKFYPWKNWKENSYNGDIYSVSPYTGFTNLNLFAFYNDGNISSKEVLTIYSDKYTTKAESVIVFGTGTDAPHSFAPMKVNDGKLKLSTKDNYLYFFVQNDSNYNKFTKIRAEVASLGSQYKDLGEGTYRTLDWSGSETATITYQYWSIPINSYSKGTYYISIKAYKNDFAEPYIYNIFMQLDDK